jgi:hypothetical protein
LASSGSEAELRKPNKFASKHLTNEPTRFTLQGCCGNAAKAV